MYAGQLVEEGTVRQLLKAPRHPYSRALIDCLPNLNDTSRHSRLAAIPGQVPNPGALPAGRSEEHTSELQSLMRISSAVFCLKKKTSPSPQITISPADNPIHTKHLQ